MIEIEYLATGLYKSVEAQEKLRAIKKPFYNEFEKTEQIKELVKSTPNDQELGEKIREMFYGS